MTQEEKELLLKDLCARLPYYPRTKIHIFTKGEYAPSTKIENLVSVEMWKVRNEECQWLINDYLLEDIKPYLRPMSSMAKEEDKEYAEVIVKSQDCSLENSESATTMANDWLLSKGFDVRGLILKGLAIEAPDGMY